MSELAFGIAAYAAYGLQAAAESGTRWLSPDETDFVASPLPALLRRRVSPLGQAALRSAWALPCLRDARFVFASRHGEFERTVAMLTQLAQQDRPSPADFSRGVHNALAGLLSVATGNRRGHTALAAGIDSFGFGLLEAVACLHESPGEPGVMVYSETSPVGTFKPNAFGVYDTAGNVTQWVEDRWNATYDGAPQDGSAWETGDQRRRVMRSGSWYNGPGDQEASFRNADSLRVHNKKIGFRVAVTLRDR